MSGDRDKGQEAGVTPEVAPDAPDAPVAPVAREVLPSQEDAEATWIVFVNDDGERERITVAEYLARGL